MGRRKKPEEWRGVEFLLLHEAEIRQAVKDDRRELSFIRSSCHPGRRGSKQPDRTGALAVKLAEEIRAIVLDNGRTIYRPESWLEVFDEVRRKAKAQEKSEWILESWKERYSEGGIRFVGESISGQLDRHLSGEGLIMWIIENVEAAAVDRGLLDKKEALLYGKDLRFLETCRPRRL